MRYPCCPHCGSENIHELYQVDRNEYQNFLRKVMGMECLDCKRGFELSSGWNESGWYYTDEYGHIKGAKMMPLRCPRCHSDELWFHLDGSDDCYDEIDRFYTCECWKCNTRFHAVQEADLSWWVASDGEGAYTEEVSR